MFVEVHLVAAMSHADSLSQTVKIDTFISQEMKEQLCAVRDSRAGHARRDTFFSQNHII